MGAAPALLQVRLCGQSCPGGDGGVHSGTGSAHPSCRPPHQTTSHGIQGWVREQRPSNLVTPDGISTEREGAAEVPPLSRSSVVRSPQLWFAGGGGNSAQPEATSAFALLRHICCSPAAEHPCPTSRRPREQAGEYLLSAAGAAAPTRQQPGSKSKDVCQIF